MWRETRGQCLLCRLGGQAYRVPRRGHKVQVSANSVQRKDQVADSARAGTGWSNANAFGIIGIPNRPTLSRPVNVRLLIVQACKQLTAAKQPGDDFHDVSILLSLIEQIRPSNEAPVQMREMLEICETEGDSHNGGGYFIIKTDGSGRTLVKYEGGGNVPRSARGSVAPGEIGSPIQGSSMPAFGGGHFPSVSSIASPSGF